MPHLRYELQIALRYLRARRRDAFISITTLFTAIGVMIGVAALVMVLAVMSGFEQSLRQRILTLTPQVEVLGFGGSIAGYPEMEARIDALPGVAGSDPFVVGQAMMSSAHGLSGVLVRGIDPKNAAIVTQLLQYIQQGTNSAAWRLARTTPLDTSTSKGNPVARRARRRPSRCHFPMGQWRLA